MPEASATPPENADELLPTELNALVPDAPSPEADSDADERFAPPANVDVDAALAALAGLGELVQHPDEAHDVDVPHPSAELEALEQEDAQPESITPNPMPAVSHFSAPPLSSLQRGQVASTLPALLLMGGGAALTLWLTSQQTMPTLLTLGLLALAGVALALLAYWWTSGRRSVGNLFIGLGLLGFSGLGLALPAWLPYGIVLAPGASAILTALIGRGGRGLALLGLLLLIGGGVWWLVVGGAL